MLAKFHDQFLVARAASGIHDNWQSFRCGRWLLAAHPSLRVRRIRTVDGADGGFALGHLIDRRGEYVHGDLTLPADVRLGSFAPDSDAIERFLYQFGGRFACLVLLPGHERMYLDPFGTLAAVWCPERERIASTPTLLLHDEPDHTVFRDNFQPGLARRPNQYFPAGLTAVPGIHRLVPNHYLDLATWTMTRHHPKACARAAEDDIPGIVATVQEAISRQIAAVVRECGGAYIGLTAGRDSRRVLACARDVVDGVECFTLRSRRAQVGMKWDMDFQTASAVAALAGARHGAAYMGRTRGRAGSRYVRRIGYSGGAGKGAKFSGPPMRHLDLSRGWMTGHGGGLCIARYFSRLKRRTRFSTDDVLDMLQLVPQAGFDAAVDRWLAGLPDVPPTLALDLTIVEHQGGSWIAPHMYGTAPFRMNILPIVHRDAIDGILSLPPKYRTSGALDRDLFARTWPELLEVPFNEYIGPRRWVHNVRKAIYFSRRAAKAARRRLSTRGS